MRDKCSKFLVSSRYIEKTGSDSNVRATPLKRRLGHYNVSYISYNHILLQCLRKRRAQNLLASLTTNLAMWRVETCRLVNDKFAKMLHTEWNLS